MKVLIDTNVFLSFILTSNSQRVITSVVVSCFKLDEIRLLVPPEQIAELTKTVATKRYFRKHVPHSTINKFVMELKPYSSLEALPESPASFSRDPDDDFLVAYGIVNDADFLITGDEDLLVLNRIGKLQIVTPAQFLQNLKNLELL